MHITDSMLHHMLAVARESYILAKRQGMTEQECRNAFALGFIHNIGYEFTDVPENQQIVGFEMFHNLTGISAIRDKGSTSAMQSQPHKMLRILNAADLSLNSVGDYVGPKGRLKDIEQRYGAASDKYRMARQMAELLGINIK